GGTIATITDAGIDVFGAFPCPLTTNAVNDDSFEPAPDSNFGVASGTSASAPFVSATAALILSMNPNLTYTQVAQQIMNNTDSLNGNTGWDSKTGYGRLNVYKALLNTNGGQITNYVKTFNSPNPFYVDLVNSTNITLVLSQPAQAE